MNNNFFIRTCEKLCEENNVVINFNELNNSFEIYEKMVEMGISQDDIIKFFSREINLPFYNIVEKKIDFSSFNLNDLESLTENNIYPFIEDDITMVAISDKKEMEKAEELIKKENYMFCFSFDFLMNIAYENLDSNDLEEAEETGLSTINKNKNTVLLATGQNDIDSIFEDSTVFKDKYIPIGKIENRKQIIPFCEKESPDILLVGDNIGGASSLTETLLKLHSSFPNIRIVYISGSVDGNDTIKKFSLGVLASAGINDIIKTNDISIPILRNALDNPKTYSDNKELIEQIKDSSKNKKNTINIILPNKEENNSGINVYKNLFTFSSPVGNSGKSTLVQNIAIGLSKYGKSENKEKLKIGIIDLDFENFSTGSFFGTLNNKRNIFNAIDETLTIINPNGSLKGVEKNREIEANENIRKSFKTSIKFSNIKVLSGTDKIYHKGDTKKINQFILTYIVESVIDDFDILLIDGNTDMDASFIYPLYTLSNKTYFVIDMNWNSIMKSKRYFNYLKNNNLMVKNQSEFILNKFISEESLHLDLKQIESGLDVSFRNVLPLIYSPIMFNLNSMGRSLLLNSEISDKDKYYFFKLINDIHEIDKFKELNFKNDDNKKIKLTKKTIKLEQNKNNFIDTIIGKIKGGLNGKQ